MDDLIGEFIVDAGFYDDGSECCVIYRNHQNESTFDSIEDFQKELCNTIFGNSFCKVETFHGKILHKDKTHVYVGIKNVDYKGKECLKVNRILKSDIINIIPMIKIM